MIVKYLKWVLPVLFIGYYGIITLFTHVHIEEGTSIIHAHPFKKTTDGTCHTHASFAEIILFHTLSTIHVADGAIHSLLLDDFQDQYCTLLFNTVSPDLRIQIIGEPTLRAPPFV